MFAISLGDGAELGPLEPWQAEEYLAHIDRGRDFIGQYIKLTDVAVDLPSARAFLQSYADRQAADGGRIFGIRLDGTLVGGVLFPHFDAATGCCEVGCWLEPAAVGRGLITRAAGLLIDWAVDVRGMHRVEWQAARGNTGSVNVAKRLGMVHEGVLRQNHLHRGTRYDTEVWALLASEWKAHREH
ncbi:GNAT family N-acetyltransferase [Streptomyces sp. NPDC059398]|uniref:GNAT family N-acetyltransferase n=1 Tax=Streptomyces sp. NPDC059398 TaxID=3346820 RepID=UPI0036B25F47